MKITDTIKTEHKIVEIYKSSKGKSAEAEQAKNVVNLIIQYFELISLFTNVRHVDIVKRIYFSADNLFVVGMRGIAQRLYLHENTLYSYRKKYCTVINTIFLLLNLNGTGKVLL